MGLIARVTSNGKATCDTGLIAVHSPVTNSTSYDYRANYV